MQSDQGVEERRAERPFLRVAQKMAVIEQVAARALALDRVRHGLVALGTDIHGFGTIIPPSAAQRPCFRE